MSYDGEERKGEYYLNVNYFSVTKSEQRISQVSTFLKLNFFNI